MLMFTLARQPDGYTNPLSSPSLLLLLFFPPHRKAIVLITDAHTDTYHAHHQAYWRDVLLPFLLPAGFLPLTLVPCPP